MKVVNVHRRPLAVPPEKVGALIDQLASPQDALWPSHSWPRMRLDGPLAAGAHGGHGPIRYRVEHVEPGQSVRFRFTGPAGFDGWHALRLLHAGASACVIEHRIEMRLRGRALLSWPLLYRPLHDALIEDAFTQAEASLGLPVQVKPWPASVRLLRALMTWLQTALRPSAVGRGRHAA